LAGSVAGGIWRSTDGGTTWNPVSDVLSNMAVSCLAMDPSNPDIIYAGTGEGFYNTDAVQGFGILRGGWQDWSNFVRTRPGSPDFPRQLTRACHAAAHMAEIITALTVSVTAA
jgi:hypothetical protein